MQKGGREKNWWKRLLNKAQNQIDPQRLLRLVVEEEENVQISTPNTSLRLFVKLSASRETPQVTDQNEVSKS